MLLLKISDVLNKKNSSIYFIGIGGVSMSSLAKLLKADGHKISGSDMKLSDNIISLKDNGIDVVIGHSEKNIGDFDMVVYTAAISRDNPELTASYEKNILTVERCDLLGEIMKNYKYPINISGTHGKTTTTSMVSSIFLEAKLSPTVSIGGDFAKIGGNLNIGNKDYFICEACEYVESFLKFHPFYTVILNIEADHLDYFKDIEHIKSAFLKFAKRTDENGAVIINGDDKNCQAIKPLISRKTFTFGLNESNNIYAKNITYENGFPSFDVYFSGELMGRVTLGVYGEHNVMNSLGAILCALLSGIDFETIKAGLLDFSGAKRRFEFKGEFKGAEVYDDYAHHPTEIETTINSAHKKDYNNLYIIFQPHTYTRTMALMDDFAKVLSKTKNVIITDIYAAREKNIYGISSKDLAEKIPGAKYMAEFDEILDFLKDTVKENDLILTVGAGDVFKIGEILLDS